MDLPPSEGSSGSDSDADGDMMVGSPESDTDAGEDIPEGSPGSDPHAGEDMLPECPLLNWAEWWISCWDPQELSLPHHIHEIIINHNVDFQELIEDMGCKYGPPNAPDPQLSPALPPPDYLDPNCPRGCNHEFERVGYVFGGQCYGPTCLNH